jgi:hypothetical protein
MQIKIIFISLVFFFACKKEEIILNESEKKIIGVWHLDFIKLHPDQTAQDLKQINCFTKNAKQMSMIFNKDKTGLHHLVASNSFIWHDENGVYKLNRHIFLSELTWTENNQLKALSHKILGCKRNNPLLPLPELIDLQEAVEIYYKKIQ